MSKPSLTCEARERIGAADWLSLWALVHAAMQI